MSIGWIDIPGIYLQVCTFYWVFFLSTMHVIGQTTYWHRGTQIIVCMNWQVPIQILDNYATIGTFGILWRRKHPCTMTFVGQDHGNILKKGKWKANIIIVWRWRNIIFFAKRQNYWILDKDTSQYWYYNDSSKIISGHDKFSHWLFVWHFLLSQQ